jgi:hypothetical protein
MWKRFDKYYTVEPYHDSTFACDDAGQQAMLAVSLQKDRRVLTAFVTMMASFVLMITTLFVIKRLDVSSLIPLLGLGALLFVGAFLFGAILHLTGRPRLKCSRCGQRMKTDWGPIQGERDGEFQICAACRTYVFNYRMSR